MKAYGPKLNNKSHKSGLIHEADFKYMQQNPDGDVGFSVEHNQAVMAETIKKTKKREAELRKQYSEQVAERVDASVSFLKALESGKYANMSSNDAALKHFGKRELARLRGEEIRTKLRTIFMSN